MANSEKRNKHTTLEDRIKIQKCSCKGIAFKAIGQRIIKDKNISKGVKLHAKPTPTVLPKRKNAVKGCCNHSLYATDVPKRITVTVPISAEDNKIRLHKKNISPYLWNQEKKFSNAKLYDVTA